MGTGMYTDIERAKQIDSLIHANANLARETMLLTLATRMPTATELRSQIPPQGMPMDDFERYYNDFCGSKERAQVFHQLMLENVEFDMETQRLHVKEPGACTSDADFFR